MLGLYPIILNLSISLLQPSPLRGIKETMPTEKPKIIFVADQELIERLDDFRFSNRVNSRSEAIRILLEEALAQHESTGKKQPPR